MTVDPDLTHPANQQDPYPAYRWLREHDPVHWNDRLRMWVVTRHDDVQGVLQEPARYSVDRFRKGSVAGGARDDLEAIGRLLRDWTVYRDPPDHTRLRRLLGRAFTAQRLDALRPRIEALVDGLIAERARAEEIEFLQAFAFPLPAAVVAAILGVPADDLPAIKAWSDRIARYVGGAQGSGSLDHAKQGVLEAADYFRGLVHERERAPRDDLISVMVAGRRSGEMRSEDEVVANCVLLVFAGHETTTNLLGNGLFHLLRHPEQYRRLREQPDLVPSAVEEFLRFDTPVSGTLRVALDDGELGGRMLRAGDTVALFLASANRDPTRFDQPDQLLIDRGGHHITFGHGLHFCLGGPLARLEAQIAFRALLAHFEELSLVDSEARWKPQVFFRGLVELPLTLRWRDRARA